MTPVPPMMLSAPLRLGGAIGAAGSRPAGRAARLRSGRFAALAAFRQSLGRSRAGREEAAAVLRPGPQAGQDRGGPGFAERPGSGSVRRAAGRPRRARPPTATLRAASSFRLISIAGRGDRDRDEHHGAEPGEHLAVHGRALSCRCSGTCGRCPLVAGARRQEAAALLTTLLGGRGRSASVESSARDRWRRRRR